MWHSQSSSSQIGAEFLHKDSPQSDTAFLPLMQSTAIVGSINNNTIQCNIQSTYKD